VIKDKNETQHLINIKSERVSCEADSGKLSSDVWKQFIRVKIDKAMCDTLNALIAVTR